MVEFVSTIGSVRVLCSLIEKGYAEFFASNPGVKIQVTLDAVNLLSPTTAVEDGHAVSERSATSPPSLSRYTVIHVKVDGNWLMASVRDTNIETPAPASSSTDLEWLIGTWVAEEHGVKVESVCSWVVDERFLERKYTTTQLDGKQSSGVQLIGWNPLGGHVQSWTIASIGAFATTPADGDWLPLGVFALSKSDTTKLDVTIQLAVNKDGVIRGNSTDTQTDKNQVIQGSVDKQTQRVAFTVGADTENVVETGLYNLTKDEAPCLIHYGKDKTEQWLLVRLQKPADSDAPQN